MIITEKKLRKLITRALIKEMEMAEEEECYEDSKGNVVCDDDPRHHNYDEEREVSSPALKSTGIVPAIIKLAIAKSGLTKKTIEGKLKRNLTPQESSEFKDLVARLKTTSHELA